MENAVGLGMPSPATRPLKPEKVKKYPGKQAYSVNGTPADCVNLAVGNLLERKPDVVVSGINLGYNVTMPMILSSGTVGGAMEASLLGLRPWQPVLHCPTKFDQIRDSGGKVKGEIAKISGCSQKRLQTMPMVIVYPYRFPGIDRA